MMYNVLTRTLLKTRKLKQHSNNFTGRMFVHNFDRTLTEDESECIIKRLHINHYSAAIMRLSDLYFVN